MASEVTDAKETLPSLKTQIFRSIKRSHDLFVSSAFCPISQDSDSLLLYQKLKYRSEYVEKLDSLSKAVNRNGSSSTDLQIWNESNHPNSRTDELFKAVTGSYTEENKRITEKVSEEMLNEIVEKINPDEKGGKTVEGLKEIAQKVISEHSDELRNKSLVPFASGMLPRRRTAFVKPKWHPPWILMRVISGHTGWVRCISVDPSNEWFVTGSADRMIKIWDLASGKLRLSLTGHISTVRGVAVSDRHPYIFSCSEDKSVKCWDLESNKVIRNYHGHLSGVYSIALHPTIDVVATGGRDSCIRIWDIRTKTCVFALSGHTNTVSSICTQAIDPQIVTGSHDSTIKFWDLTNGKSITTLTHHKKSVRGLAIYPSKKMMASGSADNIKQWLFPEGKFSQNLTGHNSIINTLSVNDDDVLVSGGDNGTLFFWDWNSGYNFQKISSKVQPGSLDCEAGINASTFDHSGSRLITCEADKTIKVYKEDENATEETHPLNWKPDLLKRKAY